MAFSWGVPSLVQAGLYNERWTAVASLSKSLYRYNDGLPAGTEFHVTEQYGCTPQAQCNANTQDCCDCSLNQHYFSDFAQNEAYLRFTAASCNGSSLRAKFVVGHEYGHAYGAMVANSSVTPSDATHNVAPSTCDFDNGGVWTGSDTYNNETKEWSSLALREGWAHFVSARIWNNKASDGQFRWGQSYDLERWTPANTAGGVLSTCCNNANQSCADSLDGAGTISDWMRGLWDMHSETCSDSPNREEMTEFFSDIINHPLFNNQTTYAISEYYAGVLFPTCGDDWEDIACHNGLNEQGVIQNVNCD